jgi:hypothetical protein
MYHEDVRNFCGMGGEGESGRGNVIQNEVGGGGGCAREINKAGPKSGVEIFA